MYYLFVFIECDRFQLTQTNQIRANEDFQFFSFPFSPFSVSTVSLMLHPHPQLVHLRKIHEDKVDTVTDLNTNILETRNFCDRINIILLPLGNSINVLFPLHHRLPTHQAKCFACIATSNFAERDHAMDAVLLCTFLLNLVTNLSSGTDLFLCKPDPLWSVNI